MAVTVSHSTAADATFSTSGATAWNANHSVSGLGTMAEQADTAVDINGGAIDGTAIGANSASTVAATTVAASSTILSTKNGAHAIGVTVAGQNFVGIGRNSSVGGVSFFDGSQGTPSDGNAEAVLSGGALKLESGNSLGWASGAVTQSQDTGLWRASANSILYNGSTTAATTTSRTEINKATTGITNAVATTVLTITIPNAAHSASIMLRVTGSLGAGGAIGANEATATNCYVISLTRTAGLATTAAISSAFGAAATAVAGAATVTCTAALAAVSGGNTATQTIDIQVTISRSAGSSTNHTCVSHASLLNANATGVTIA